MPFLSGRLRIGYCGKQTTRQRQSKNGNGPLLYNIRDFAAGTRAPLTGDSRLCTITCCLLTGRHLASVN